MRQRYHEVARSYFWVSSDIIHWSPAPYFPPPAPDNAFHLTDRFPLSSPEETAWEDGTFKLSVEFTEEYPNKAPTVKFMTKMFHPNSNLIDTLASRSPSSSICAPLYGLRTPPNTNAKISVTVQKKYCWGIVDENSKETSLGILRKILS